MYQLKQVPTEARIKTVLRKIIFGSRIHCLACSSQDVVKYEGTFRCRKCRSKFSLLSKTWLSNMKLDLQKFWLVLWCWTSHIPVRQTAQLSELSEVTIYHWFERFRNQLPKDQNVLEHLVQLDEAYFGGKKGKALFMGKEVGTRKLAWQMLSHPNPAREDAWRFLKHFIKPNTTLNTDGAGIYFGIEAWWPVTHQKDIHKKFEFEKTSEIEGMFGVLKTYIRRMYHHVTVDKLPELISEFCFKFSHPEMYGNPQYFLEISLGSVPTR